ncbi:MAG: ABC transporter permease, partial [Rhizobiaceae bacterium]|nr:ABC transporter permease [Rhizobiaceae bacterium]
MSAKSITVNATGPFSRFEWMLAGRYLRARRKETFISIITGFSFFGIMLGVATLIIVMAVMNGFRGELQSRILGINGHVIIQSLNANLTDYEAVVERVSEVEGVRYAVSLIEGQALVSSGVGGNGALIRGMSERDLDKVKELSDNIRQGTLEGFDNSEGVAIGTRMARALGLQLGDAITISSPEGYVPP